ncbi:hypothetical protein AVEN_141-1 [Araneus ventricosus]|uniref:Uncharacterized protein n=1 Tax=Araneus ventricosus TaxID=182803 RepID=A0A4Y2D372_ARAVE|nr:hypothetical protein AVEN_141-1 [Araneus ventricosus]
MVQISPGVEYPIKWSFVETKSNGDCGRPWNKRLLCQQRLARQVRNNVVFRALWGEAADVDESLCEDWTTRLPLLLAGYADKDIFNMGESFFSCPPK